VRNKSAKVPVIGFVEGGGELRKQIGKSSPRSRHQGAVFFCVMQLWGVAYSASTHDPTRRQKSSGKVNGGPRCAGSDVRDVLGNHCAGSSTERVGDRHVREVTPAKRKDRENRLQGQLTKEFRSKAGKVKVRKED